MRQGSYLTGEYARKPELIVQEPPCCRQVRLEDAGAKDWMRASRSRGDPTDLAGYLKSEVWQELRLRSAIMHVLLGGADIYYLLDTRGMPQFLILTMPKLSRS
jgi:hypothetical protein